MLALDTLCLVKVTLIFTSLVLVIKPFECSLLSLKFYLKIHVCVCLTTMDLCLWKSEFDGKQESHGSNEHHYIYSDILKMLIINTVDRINS